MLPKDRCFFKASLSKISGFNLVDNVEVAALFVLGKACHIFLPLAELCLDKHATTCLCCVPSLQSQITTRRASSRFPWDQATRCLGSYFKPKTEEFSKLRVSMIIAFRGIRTSVMLLSALCVRRFHLPLATRR
jgi:hypothetical protein